MDSKEIEKVSNRRQMTEESKKLREKLSHAATTIMKLKMSQDASYWLLKEEKSQTETNHERLQQNMVDVQMQLENTSGLYRQELLRRPETLNRLSATREIGDALQQSCERLKATLDQCAAGRNMIAKAYENMKHDVNQCIETNKKNENLIDSQKRQISLSAEHRDQMIEFFKSTKQGYDSQIEELKSKFESVNLQRDELVKIANDLTRELDSQKHTLEMKEKSYTSLQTDLKRLHHEYTSNLSEMRNNIAKLEKDLAQSNESEDAAKKALASQESYTATIRDQRNMLQEKVAALEGELSTVLDDFQALSKTYENLTKVKDSVALEVASLKEEKELVENVAAQNMKLLENSTKEIESLTSQLENLKIEKDAVLSQLNSAKKDSEDKSASLQNLSKVTEEKIKGLNDIIDMKQKDNTSKAETISKLMDDIKEGMDVRNRLQSNIDKMQMDLEKEKEQAKNFKRQYENLQRVVKDKDQELSKNMTLLLEKRKENEKLRKKISDQETLIENVQRELGGHDSTRPRRVERADLDDNAVVLQPRPQHHHNMPSNAAVPSSQVQMEDSFLNIFTSGSSVEADNEEVNPRRFSAIGQQQGDRATTLKRTRAASPMPRNLATNNRNTKDEEISLTQVRNAVALKPKPNMFFKTKRGEDRAKKPRQ